MKTIYKNTMCVMLLLLGSMNMVWASLSQYPNFNNGDKNTATWNSTEGCFEFKLLTHDDETGTFGINTNGWVRGGELSVNAIKVGTETKSGFKFLNFAETGEWYVNCSDPNNGAYGPVYVKDGSEWKKLTNTTVKYSTTGEGRFNYAIVRWYPKKTIQGVYLDKGNKIKFQAYLVEWARSNADGRENTYRYTDDIEITHNYSSTFSSNDWQIDGKWGYNLSLNTTSYKFWNIAYVTPTGQPSQWVEFSAQGISNAKVSNGKFDLAQYFTNDGTIQMYTRVYPHLNDSYSSSDPFFYDVVSSTISVKNRTLTWNEVEDGDINFYYNDQQVSLTKGQNVPGGAYDVEIGSECSATLSAQCDNIQLQKSGQKFRFNIDYGKHVLALTGQKHDCVVVPYEAPTCTETGNNEHVYCRKCSKTLAEPEWLDELGHNFEDHKCTRCGDIDITLGGLCGYNEGTIAESFSAEAVNEVAVGNQNKGQAATSDAERLASGEIAFKLNIGQNENVWYQTIGEDDYPGFDANHKKVHAVEHKETLYINEGSTVSEYTLYDGYDFNTPVHFFANHVSYSRAMSNKWGTMVLPFDIDYTKDNEIVQIYHLNEVKESLLVFSQYEDGTITAGTPVVFIRLTEEGTVTFEAENARISEETPQPQSAQPSSQSFSQPEWQLTGTYQAQNYDVKNADQGRNFYYIANDKFWHATGTIELNPFRAMYEVLNAYSAPSARFSICKEEDLANGIESLDSDLYEKDSLYDLSGRKTEDIKQGEIYMLNGQKVIFK